MSPLCVWLHIEDVMLSISVLQWTHFVCGCIRKTRCLSLHHSNVANSNLQKNQLCLSLHMEHMLLLHLSDTLFLHHSDISKSLLWFVFRISLWYSNSQSPSAHHSDIDSSTTSSWYRMLIVALDISWVRPSWCLCNMPRLNSQKEALTSSCKWDSAKGFSL